MSRGDVFFREPAKDRFNGSIQCGLHRGGHLGTLRNPKSSQLLPVPLEDFVPRRACADVTITQRHQVLAFQILRLDEIGGGMLDWTEAMSLVIETVEVPRTVLRVRSCFLADFELHETASWAVYGHTAEERQ